MNEEIINLKENINYTSAMYKLSKKIKKKYIHLIDVCIFTLAFADMLKDISVIGAISWYDQLVKIIDIVGYIILAGIILKQKVSEKFLLMYSIATVFFVYGYLKSGMSAFLTAWLVLLACKGMDYKRILRILYQCTLVTLAVSIITSLFYIGEIGQQVETGFTLGFSHKNIAGLYLCFAYILKFNMKPAKHTYIKSIAWGLFILIITQSKTAAFSVIALPFLITFYRWVVEKNKKSIIRITEILVPLYCVITYVTAVLFPISKFVQRLNQIFTNRIFLNWFILSKNKITLFGQNVQLHYSGIHNAIINQWNINTTVDGTYIILILVFGIVPTLLYIMGYIYLIYKGGTERLPLLGNNRFTFNLCNDGDKVYQHIR